MSRYIESLSDPDLLALLVGRRVAASLLKDASGSLSQLLNEPLPVEYAAPQAVSKLKAAKELVRRSLAEAMKDRDVLDSPSAVRDFLRLSIGRLEYEVFMALFLDAQNRVITPEELFRGTLNQTSVYPREVVKRALAHNAAAVIFAHNHPSGVPEPSQADEQLTRTLRSALGLLDIRVLDHFVVAGNDLVSFSERGLL